jgi:hypothetical protein
MPLDITPPDIEPEFIGAGEDMCWARTGLRENAARTAPAATADSCFVKYSSWIEYGDGTNQESGRIGRLEHVDGMTIGRVVTGSGR